MTNSTRTRRPAISDAERARRTETREQLAAQLRDDLAAKIADLADSGEWLRFLAAAARFHRYSFNNVLLILSQHPTATRVAGFRGWQDNGRQVRKGEKAIRIYGYSTRTIAETDTETGEDRTRKIPTYPILSVFAEDQTDPIPGHPGHIENPAQRLTGEDPARLYERTAAVLTARGWTVERDLLDGDTNGVTIWGLHPPRVIADARLAPAQAAKTILHEAGHVVLHAEHRDDAAAHRGIRETEAESVAYILAAMHGLDTSAYSVGYIAAWSGADPDLITNTATHVLNAVRELADALDPNHDHTDEQDAPPR